MKKLFEQQNKEDQKVFDILNSVKLRRFPIIESNSIWDFLSKQGQQDLDDKVLEDLDKVINGEEIFSQEELIAAAKLIEDQNKNDQIINEMSLYGKKF